MTQRIAVAVRKASHRRLLSDFSQAARILNQSGYHQIAGLPVPADHCAEPRGWTKGYYFGALEATQTLTLKAALLTAFGD